MLPARSTAIRGGHFGLQLIVMPGPPSLRLLCELVGIDSTRSHLYPPFTWLSGEHPPMSALDKQPLHERRVLAGQRESIGSPCADADVQKVPRRNRHHNFRSWISPPPAEIVG